MQTSPSCLKRYLFSPFTLDAHERVLLRDGQLVPVPAKALQILLVLVRNSGHLVEKEKLMNEVWPDEDVEEGNLAHHIFTLRKTLGETTKSGKYIETIPRRGYRFLGTVREVNGEPIEPGSIAQPHLPNSVAVVLFASVTGDSRLDYLADCVTESIINSLSLVPGLHVAARTSVVSYKGKEVNTREALSEPSFEN